MGYTRARRYANYKGGKKYDKLANYVASERGTGSQEKARAAAIFYDYWKRAEEVAEYKSQKKEWKKTLG